MVYQLLEQNELCEYYDLNRNPGKSQRFAVRKDKFAFLDDKQIAQSLIRYRDEKQTRVNFYLPQVHCSSCLYLLENLHRIHSGVISAKVNFPKKEVDVVFDQSAISLRELAELLAGIGYEPHISLNDLGGKKPGVKRSTIYQLGVAGFCFANIMLLSFPEYLGLDGAEKSLQGTFRFLNLILALPVFLYSAQPFYQSGWKGLKHKFLNIDAPIALAIIVTFGRSVYELATGTGSGYFDSMSGIVFFMLIGRVLQDKTYQQLSFERDYTSYFPIAVNVIRNNASVPVPLPDVKPGDTLLIHSEELIPADGILTRGKAFVDYSFVTGESEPVARDIGEIIYAGGKQTGGNIELLVIKEVAQSYLTSLWSRDEFKQTTENRQVSFVHLLSRYFTYIVFTIAAAAALYWAFHDASRIWNVITAVLIVACPCALLLSSNFTNGNILRILGRNRFYLRGAQTIEDIASADHIVFDKTGTLTSTLTQEVTYHGEPLSRDEREAVASLARHSNHPLSRALAQQLGADHVAELSGFREYPGQGTSANWGKSRLSIGSRSWILDGRAGGHSGAEVHIDINGHSPGYFSIKHPFRESIPELVKQLKGQYRFSVISGDNEAEMPYLRHLMGNETTLLFHQKPEDKLAFISQLQREGKKVMMIGDGLNDAGALRQSHIGVAITENSNNFTPASDAILEAGQLSALARFIGLCRANRRIIMAAFGLSILYNVVGLYFAVRGELSPINAAILMPASSISILLVTFGSSNLVARWLRL